MSDESRTQARGLVVVAHAGTEPARRYEVVIGTVVEVPPAGDPLVEYEGPDDEVVRRAALATVEIDARAAGHPVTLMFISGDLDRPVITGRIEPGRASPPKITRTQSLVLDGRELVLEADSLLTLRCGKSSLTLTRDGRIVLRGTNLVSRASGVNRIRGGTIKLN
jgi:hypothetical protein